MHLGGILTNAMQCCTKSPKNAIMLSFLFHVQSKTNKTPRLMQSRNNKKSFRVVRGMALSVTPEESKLVLHRSQYSGHPLQ